MKPSIKTHKNAKFFVKVYDCVLCDKKKVGTQHYFAAHKVRIQALAKITHGQPMPYECVTCRFVSVDPGTIVKHYMVEHKFSKNLPVGLRAEAPKQSLTVAASAADIVEAFLKRLQYEKDAKAAANKVIEAREQEIQRLESKVAELESELRTSKERESHIASELREASLEADVNRGLSLR